MFEILAIVALTITLSLLGRVKRVEQRMRALDEELRALRAAGVPAVADTVAGPASAVSEFAGAGTGGPAEPPVAEPHVEIAEPVADVASVAAMAAEPMAAAIDEQRPGVLDDAEPAASPEPALAPQSPSPSRPPVTSRVFEELFGSRLPIWAGGVTLAVAGFFLVKYSIDTGLLSPGVRVLLALLFGLLLIAGAEISRRVPALARDPRVAQALAGAGVAVAYIAVLIAANLYGLIGPLTAFIGLAAVTAAAIGLALRFGAPSAVLGLVGGLSAPALAGGTEANVPVLALYLMLVVAAIAGVSRRQGWLWLAVAALVGGFGWAALLIATSVIDVASAGAIGVMLLALAFGVPVLAAGRDVGDAARWLRAGTVIAAAVQLALLVMQGGFSPLVWGFYGLLAIGAVVLARIDPRQWMLPPVALGVALVTIALWPAPDPKMLIAVAGGLIAILAAPALIDAWHADRGRVGAAQGSAALLGAIAVGWLRFPELLSGWGWGLTALIFASAPALAAMRGWQLSERREDWRFALLASASAALAVIAAAVALPGGWLSPVLAAIACAIVWLARVAEDRFLEWTPRIIAIGTALHLIGLVVDGALPAGWAGTLVLLATAALFLLAGHVERSRWFGAPWLAAGALIVAQALWRILPDDWPVIGCAILAWGAAFTGDRLPWLRARPVAFTLAGVVLASMLTGLMIWLPEAAQALAGNYVLAGDLPTPRRALLLMALPAIGIVAMAFTTRAVAWQKARLALAALCGAVFVAAGHVLFKQIFAIDDRGGIVAYAFAERVILTQGLFAAGMAALWQAHRHELLRPAGLALLALATFRLVWFDIVCFNPMLRDQAVGPWPVANLLLPAYGLPLLWLHCFGRLEPDLATRLRHPLNGLAMLLVLTLVAASVRQWFEGGILTGPGVSQREDIVRSIAGIGLAIGFLRHGIARGDKAWRIAALVLMLATVLKVFLWDAKGLEGLLRIGSFVALGFSLIGIGFLYNRYLSGAGGQEGAEEAA